MVVSVIASEECTIPTTCVVFAPIMNHSHKTYQQQQNLRKFFPFFPSKEIDSSYMVKGEKKTKKRKNPPTESCTLQCNNLTTNRFGSCVWSNQPLFDQHLCTTLNLCCVVEVFKVMGGAF